MAVSLKLCVLLMLLPCVFSNSIYNRLNRYKRQLQISNNECNQADIVFVLDSSGSIGEENWLKVLNFTKQVIQNLTIGENNIRVGIITYGTRATPNLYLNTTYNKTVMLDMVDQIKWKDQETNTSGALWYMQEKLFTFDRGDRPRAPNLAIVMTDGESNRDQHLTIPIAEEIKASGKITVYAIGVGNKISLPELNAIASNSSYVFNVTGFRMLGEIQSQVVTAACDIPVECHEDADITFILDSSASMTVQNFNKLKTFVASIIDLINVEANQSNVALITFSDSAIIEFQLNKYQTRSEIQRAIMNVTYQGGTTNTAAAFQKAREEVYLQSKGDRPNVRNIIMYFTDGNSNSLQLTLEQAQKTKDAGITIIAVAVTDWIQMDEVREIASDPDALNVFQVKLNDISTISRDLKKILCDQINECDSKPCRNGGVCVNGVNKYSCMCPQGTAGVRCEYKCSPVDVVMAIDSSGSIGRNNYYKVLDFAKDFANSMNFQSGNAQMGVETFTGSTDIKFNLNQYNSKEKIVNAISFPYLYGGTTNTAEALQVMREVMFANGNGHRQGVRKVGIVVTDGKSNNRDQTFQQATLARDSDITLLSVAVNIKNKQGIMELDGITSDPDSKNVMHVTNFDTLTNVTDSLVMAACKTVDNCEPNPCHSSAECVDMVNTYKCVCPIGRSGRHCERNCDGRADIIFIVDSSGSIRESRFQIVKDYVKSIVNELEISQDKVRVALMQFSDNSKVLFYLNKYSRKEDVLQSIEMMPYTRGATNTADALKILRTEVATEKNGDRLFVPTYGVLITDGESTVNRQETLPEAVLARIAGIHMIVVAVGDRSKSLEIKGIASDPDSFNIYSVTNFGDLATKSMPVINGMCDTIDDCASNPCQHGGTCVNGLGQYICMCLDEYTGYNCERGCTSRSDVVFVLDASGSVEKNFALATNLTRKIVQGLNFAGDRSQVGIVTYSDGAMVRFQLNTYKYLDEVQNAIAFTLMNGRTNTYQGVREMRINMFTSGNGDRSGVPNFGIVITDGRSNLEASKTLPEAGIAKDSDNIKLFAVGIGQNGQVDRGEINGIASNPDSDYAYFMQNENELMGIANKILDVICQ